MDDDDLTRYDVLPAIDPLDATFTTIDNLSTQLPSLSHKCALKLAIACLRRFLQLNFTQPDATNADVADISIVDQLSFGLNRPSIHCRSLHHLLAAKLILLDRNDNDQLFVAYPIAHWWCIRMMIVWQRVLIDRSAPLHQLIAKHDVAFLASTTFIHLTNAHRAEYRLELTHSHMLYFEYEKANDRLKSACREVDVEVHYGGALGRRTRFQQHDVAQLVLTVEHVAGYDGEMVDEGDVGVVTCPINRLLDDETLLESTKLVNDRDDARRLAPIQQAAVVTMTIFDANYDYQSELCDERAMKQIEYIVSQPKCWSIQYAALHLRNRIEKKNSRRVERAMRQADELIESAITTTADSDNGARLKLAIAVNVQPIWKMRMAYAELLKSIGCIREALSIYEKLDDWEEVVECYKSMGKLDRAEHIVRKLISEKPTESLYYCLLGDITMNADDYKKAIELSSGKSSRAYLALGRLMLHQHSRIADAYTNIKSSVELQPLQLGAWFTLGHCAYQLEMFAESARAYHRCVSIEPDHFEAWNNLCAVYVRMQQKERACDILREAIKYNFDHAKIWENYLMLCIDTRRFNYAVQAYNRLLDIKSKHNDAEVLTILAIEAMRVDENNALDESLRNDVLKLFGRITAQQTSDAQVCRSYALLYQPRDATIEHDEKYIQLMQKAIRIDTQIKDWQKNDTIRQRVLVDAEQWADAQLQLVEKKPTSSQFIYGSIRMTLRPIIVACTMHLDEKSSDEPIIERLQTIVAQLPIASATAEMELA